MQSSMTQIFATFEKIAKDPQKSISVESKVFGVV